MFFNNKRRLKPLKLQIHKTVPNQGPPIIHEHLVYCMIFSSRQGDISILGLCFSLCIHWKPKARRAQT